MEGADFSFLVQIKHGIGTDMILEMDNTTKTQVGSTREILIKVKFISYELYGMTHAV